MFGSYKKARLLESFRWLHRSRSSAPFFTPFYELRPPGHVCCSNRGCGVVVWHSGTLIIVFVVLAGSRFGCSDCGAIWIDLPKDSGIPAPNPLATRSTLTMERCEAHESF